MSNLIQLSIHNTVVNKPEKRSYVDEEGEVRTGNFIGDQKINLGFGWVNAELEWGDILELLLVDGRSIAPYLKDDSKNRSASNFASHQLVFIDIDGGDLFQTLMHEIYDYAGAGYYTTHSHSSREHHFRLMHVLETPITDAERMRRLYRGLLDAYGNSNPDTSCHDPARLFYGNSNPADCDITGRIMPDWLVDELVKKGHALIEAQFQANLALAADREAPSEPERAAILKALSRVGKLQHDAAPLGGKIHYQWMSIGFALKSGGFSEEDFVWLTPYITEQAGKVQEARTLWRSAVPSGGITMATVWKLLRHRYGNDLQYYIPDKPRETNISNNPIKSVAGSTMDQVRQVMFSKGYAQ